MEASRHAACVRLGSGFAPRQKAPMRLDRKTQLSIAYAILTILLLLVMQSYFEGQVDSVKYSDFRQWVVEGRVAEVYVGADDISGKYYADGVGEGGLRTFSVSRIEDPELVELLQEHVPQFAGKREPTWLTSLLGWILPAVFFVGIWMFMARRMSGGSGGLMSIGKSKAKVYMEKGTGITFDDVAGIDEAKEELEEIVEFLRTPERFQALGGKIPRGVLLVGAPGTGKTLLAKAVAGEAGVPFFSISGSQFVEMFVGVGAARVRDLFEQAKKHAPAIIFIDELDALGKARGVGSFGGHDEREQTLNQLLTELDGFDTNNGIILMAATNRPEILDPALLRPGRFDRTVSVDRPDVKGREAILKIHSKDVKLDSGVNLRRMAVRTPGFSGADLANIVNEAALLAARRNKSAITMDELTEAVERAVAGLERKSRVLNEKERRVVAYHEAGHAIVGELVDDTNPVQKISIIPRGVGALGYTLNSPVEDRYLMTKPELLGRICGLLGGRAAEDLVFKENTTGAANDLMRATQVAESMVKEYGMSETLGLVAHRDDRNQSQFLGMGGSDRDYSEDTARRIDEEVNDIISGCYRRAVEVLGNRRDVLEEVVEVLFDQEIMEGEQLRRMLGRAPADGDLESISGNGSAAEPAAETADASSSEVADVAPADVADTPGKVAPADGTPGTDIGH